MFYYIAKMVLSLYFHLVYRIKVTGKENIPQSGGVIVCGNHIGYPDPMILGITLNRKIHFMGKKELFKNPLFSWVLRQLCVFPVDRQAVGMGTLKKALNVLNGDKVLGIFAQGTRMNEIDTKNAKAGVALFAVKADVPIVPVGIKSSYKFFSKVNINIGTPITLNEYRGVKVRSKDLNDITENVMANIQKLCDEMETAG